MIQIVNPSCHLKQIPSAPSSTPAPPSLEAAAGVLLHQEQAAPPPFAPPRHLRRAFNLTEPGRARSSHSASFDLITPIAVKPTYPRGHRYSFPVMTVLQPVHPSRRCRSALCLVVFSDPRPLHPHLCRTDLPSPSSSRRPITPWLIHAVSDEPSPAATSRIYPDAAMIDSVQAVICFPSPISSKTRVSFRHRRLRSTSPLSSSLAPCGVPINLFASLCAIKKENGNEIEVNKGTTRSTNLTKGAQVISLGVKGARRK